MKLFALVNIYDVITCANFSDDKFMCLRVVEVRFSFLLTLHRRPSECVMHSCLMYLLKCECEPDTLL